MKERRRETREVARACARYDAACVVAYEVRERGDAAMARYATRRALIDAISRARAMPRIEAMSDDAAYDAMQPNTMRLLAAERQRHAMQRCCHLYILCLYFIVDELC